MDDGLERQLERGGFFTHTVLSHHADRINEAEAFLYGLIDVLLQKQLVSDVEITDAVQKIKRETEEKGEGAVAGVALRRDDLKDDLFVPVNCEERMHICKSVCCKLNFALSVEEVESGKIKWDMGEPYFIRHEKDGYCSHVNRKTGGCTVYGNRPGVCKKYSCAKDGRIWKNFEKMELNEEWINNHLGSTSPQLVRRNMLI